MDLKIVNRASQFPKIVDFEDLVEIRRGLFQLSCFSYQKSVTRVQFWNSKFHVAPHLCRPKQNQVYEDKSVNKSTRSSRPPRFHEMLGVPDFCLCLRSFYKILLRETIPEPPDQRTDVRSMSIRSEHTKKPMSSLSHHDDDCNARDVATEPQTTDQLVD
jgi:hypothetical protein